MYEFPKNLYTDIRIETVNKTEILVKNHELIQNKTSKEIGAMIRIFDGKRWYYSSTTDIHHIQDEINQLTKLANPDPEINSNPVVRLMEVHNTTEKRFQESDIRKIPNKEKVNVLMSYDPIYKECKEIQLSRLYYIDNYTEKHFVSSKGTNITFDTQFVSLDFRYLLVVNTLPYNGDFNIYDLSFDKLFNEQEKAREVLKEDLFYAYHAEPVLPGLYTCILSPAIAGVFAHESFGHKSESDFMIGDETMKKEWAIGSKVGSSILNIIDTGMIDGAGLVPYDDEGCKAKENYIIKKGILTGRLHSAYTAASLAEELTGNARAMNFEYEPIVRMTTTYIGAGTLSKEKLFSQVTEGIYIKDYKHGSGMSTFTIAPKKAYMIRNGKIEKPVKISVITGNVMETLNEIDGLSDTQKLYSNALGGCGKMEQYPLRVSFGGPYVRVNNINVQ